MVPPISETIRFEIIGYGPRQVQELEETIGRTPCDLVLIATPIDLRRILLISQPTQRVWYELREISSPTLLDVLRKKFGRWRDNTGHDLAHGASLIAAGNLERSQRHCLGADNTTRGCCTVKMAIPDALAVTLLGAMPKKSAAQSRSPITPKVAGIFNKPAPS